MKENSNKGILICLIIFIVLLVGIGGFIVYDKLMTNKETEKSTTTTKNETSEKNDEIDNKTEEENTKPISFYDGKCLNDDENNFELSELNFSDEVHIQTFDKNKNTVRIFVLWDSVKTNWGMSTSKNGVEFYEINNFSGKVIDIYFDGNGQDVGGSTLLFLLEDGSVEYLPIGKCLENADFKSYGKLPGVSGILKFYSVSAMPKNSEVGGYVTVLAQKASGDYYNLAPLLRATGNY